MMRTTATINRSTVRFTTTRFYVRPHCGTTALRYEVVTGNLLKRAVAVWLILIAVEFVHGLLHVRRIQSRSCSSGFFGSCSPLPSSWASGTSFSGVHGRAWARTTICRRAGCFRLSW
jgi:hypothetical protein